MEVRSEQPFSIGMQKSAVTAKPSIPGMRLTMTHDGTAVYKPTQAISSVLDPPFHGGNSNGNSAAPAALNMTSSDLAKKKRGRPRKYAQDGSMALALAPVSAISGAQQDRGGFSSLSMGQENVDPFVPGCLPMKKARGRPSGSGKKLQLLALGAAGTGFTPHVITVNAGEDVSSKILSFSQHGPRAICILSANGAISNVTLRQANTSGGTVTYEGRFEILSLSGSFLLSENGGQRSRTGGLSVSLSGPDGRVVGGGVAGLLTAASPVQVVVASFISDKKEKKQNHPVDSAPAIERLASVDIIPGNGGLITGDGSPPSRGALSGSSGGPASPLNQSMSTFNSNNQQGFSGVLWK